jgi:hypothetical protein
MDPATLASALAAARSGQVQAAMGAKMLKMNAEAAQSIVKVLDAAQENIARITADGLGAKVDITV